MKKLFAVILVALIAIPVFSQLKFGIKAGVATTTVPKYDNVSGTTTITAMKNSSFGFNAGIFLRLTLLGIYIQPEVLFATNKYEYNISNVTAPKTQTFNRLDVPILLGIKLGPIRINAGPAATIPIGSPDALIDDPNFNKLYKGATFGYQAGLGFDLFKKLTIDARYEGSLSKQFGNTAQIGGGSFKLDSRQPAVSLSIGIMF